MYDLVLPQTENQKKKKQNLKTNGEEAGRRVHVDILLLIDILLVVTNYFCMHFIS